MKHAKYNFYLLSRLPFLKRAERTFPESREWSPENLMNSRVLSTWGLSVSLHGDCCVSMKCSNSLELGQLLLPAQSFFGLLNGHFPFFVWVLFNFMPWWPGWHVFCAFKAHFAFSEMGESQILKGLKPGWRSQNIRNRNWTKQPTPK